MVMEMRYDVIICSECKGKFPRALTEDLYDKIVCYECAYEYRVEYAKGICHNLWGPNG